MKKNTLVNFSIAILTLIYLNIGEVRANFVPGVFNGWIQNTPYSTTNMPAGYKKYTCQTSDNAQFKLLMWNDNWIWGWGTNVGWDFNNWNTVWTVNWNTNIENSTIKNFGTNQHMTIVTSTSLSQVDSKFGFLKTSATPINISSVSGGISNVNTNNSVIINITLSGSKSSEEFVLIRYTTNNWSSSSFVTATGSGTSYSATIPGQAANTTVQWYALTSTLETPSIDTDYLTLSVLNNSGSNYNYFTGESSATDYFRSKASGNWNTEGTWESSLTGSSDWVTATLVPGSSAASITIQDSHNITLDGNVSVAGLTINSGATFTASDATPRTLIITKSASGSSTTLANSGTWVNGDGGSTVVFTGAPNSGDAVHAVTGAISFQNITVNKTGGDSNVGAGFGEGSSVSGTLQIGAGGYISADPPASFYGDNAILAFNQGIGVEYVVNSTDKTWSTSQVPNSITITSGTVTLNDNRTATGDLIITSGAGLNINAGRQLKIENSFTQAGSLNLKSTSDGTATIITPATVTITGTTTVQQYLAANRNYYMAAPVSNAIIPEGNNYYKFVEALNNGSTWSDVTPNGSLTFNMGVGYIVKPLTTETTIQFSGTMNEGSKTISGLTSTGTTPAKARFNLVGNPYPSYLNWNAVTKNNVGNTMWYRTHNGTNYAFYTYHTVDGRGGIGVPTTVTNWIPPMQAFWVRVDNGQTGSLGLSNEMRNHQDVSGNVLKAPSQKQADFPLIRLVVSNSVNSDETVVYFNENAVNTFDSYDSEKMFVNNTNFPEIYTSAGNEQLVINGMTNYFPGLELPLGFNTGQNNNFSIRASQLLNIDDVKVILRDQLTSTEFDLTSGDAYEFTSVVTSGVDRFSILFKSTSGTTGECCDITNAGIFAFSNQGRIQLTSNYALSENASVSVFNGLGQLVHKQLLTNLNTTINTNFNKGIYLLKVEDGAKTLVLRTLVK